MTTLMEKVRGVFAEKQARKIRGFDELVQRAIAGDELEPLEVAAVLDAAGKSPDEFEHVVQVAKDQEIWQQQVDELPQLQQAANEIEAAQKSLVLGGDREVMAVRQRQRVEASELSRQLGIVVRKIDAANEAATDLHKTKPPEVKAAELAKSALIRGLMNERDSLSEDVQLFRQHQKRGGTHDRGVARIAEIDAEIKALQGTSR